jgi:hypothetical protein
MTDWRSLVDKDVEVTHWTGMRFNGRLIGICEQPSLILETEDGERVTYGVDSLQAVREQGSVACQKSHAQPVAVAVSEECPQPSGKAVDAGWALNDAIIDALRDEPERPDPQRLWQAVEVWQADAPERVD